MISVSIAERFNTPEYMKFRDIVSKSGLDASLKIKNNKVVFGNSSVQVPFFQSVTTLKEELEGKKQKLLLEFNDLYEKIIISDEPIVYKNRYQNVSSNIEQIDVLIDEIDSYISSINEIKVHNPISVIEHEIEKNSNDMKYLVETTKDDVHISKKAINKLVVYHNNSIKLEQKLKEAKEVNEINYIIWDKPLQSELVETEQVNLTYRKATSTKKLTPAKKVVIKKATKKLMIERLS